VLIVLTVFYAGLLLFLISGPSMDDVDNLRKIAFWVLLLRLWLRDADLPGRAHIRHGTADEAVRERGISPRDDEEG
jgi:hypothetical protein